MNIDLKFSRKLLQLGMANVRRHAMPEDIKNAWVWNFQGDHWEFHGPQKFYWHGTAANAYEARYKGWMAWLKQKGKLA